jgi:hypothetical protein
MAFDQKKYRAEWYKKNRESQLQRAKEWRTNNPEKAKAAELKTRARKEQDPESFLGHLFSGVKKGAKHGRSREIKVSITKDDLRKMLIASKGKCALSGLQMDIKFNSRYKVSVDRINSNKSYTKTNIQLVATCVNKAKMDLKQEEFIAMCKAIAKKC